MAPAAGNVDASEIAAGRAVTAVVVLQPAIDEDPDAQVAAPAPLLAQRRKATRRTSRPCRIGRRDGNWDRRI